ncbi:hypothetical protein BpHYR1_017565 [Brachionus plicatilis]|uniref:Uncharacterized protein n=1 Tax=Brachionus plicatilis TaxID=10195 RepID=A0A3M7RWZ4_BRAPC|nr:hypothetical protein BpHYR1_017565 [Brachionus plicatilis]
MNTSLSTVDTLFNGQYLNVVLQGESVLRSSPSFNDSEPPSYFEAIGINHVNLNQIESVNTSRLPSFRNDRLPKISLQIAPESRIKQYSRGTSTSIGQSTNHTRGTNRLPVDIFQQNATQFHENENRVMSEITQPSETYFVWSIFTTFYCVLVGLPALIFSIKVYHYNKEEEYEKAFSRSKIVWYLNLTGLFCGIVYVGIVVLILFVSSN